MHSPFFPSSVVMFGGSRRLAPGAGASGLIAAVVARALQSGAALSVGCAAGADQAVIQFALAAGAARRLAVFAVGGVRGGWPPRAARAFVSGPPPWVVAASRAGAAVSWWAGGGAAVPLRARLATRSRAAVLAAAGGCAVFFVSSPFSRGSWLTAIAALAQGLPVFAFPVGLPAAALAPLPGCAGRWVPVRRHGLWSAAVRWSPAQKSLF